MKFLELTSKVLLILSTEATLCPKSGLIQNNRSVSSFWTNTDCIKTHIKRLMHRAETTRLMVSPPTFARHFCMHCSRRQQSSSLDLDLHCPTYKCIIMLIYTPKRQSYYGSTCDGRAVASIQSLSTLSVQQFSSDLEYLNQALLPAKSHQALLEL